MIYKDQLNREVRLESAPSRIISLVPSITELLFDLGLEKEIVGITKFCIHPKSVFKNKTRVGGTKKIDFDKIANLSPDLIIANKEENTFSDIAALENKYPVWVSDIKTLDDALSMITMIGELTGKEIKSGEINNEIRNNFNFIHSLSNIPTLYLIWNKPYMGAGYDTFINDLLLRCGMTNVLAAHNRYPVLSDALIQDLNPAVVLLSSEPYPFKEKHIKPIQSLLPQSLVIPANGEYFSWYGSRLTEAPLYFSKLIENITNLIPVTTFYENK